MTKQEWQSTLERLDGYYREFNKHHGPSRNGKNRKIREEASRNLSYPMQHATRLIREDEELKQLLTNDSSNFGRVIAFDEFRDPTYFSRDMASIMRKIREKIDSMED